MKFNLKSVTKRVPELAGMVGYSFVDPQIDRVIPAGAPSWAASALKVVGGIMISDTKSPVLKGLGTAMTVVGANEIAQEITFAQGGGATDVATTTGVKESVSSSVGRI